MFTYLSLECRALKDVIEKSLKNSDKVGTRQLFDGTVYHEHPPDLQDLIAKQDGLCLPAQLLSGLKKARKPICIGTLFSAIL